MSGSTTELRVELPAGLTVMSLRDYLQKQRGLSHTLWKRLKHSGTLRVNGEPVIAVRAIVHDGDHVSYDITRKSDIVPEPLPLDIRYEDDDLLIVNKPAGMLVHPTTQEGHGTLGNAVLAHFANNAIVVVIYALMSGDSTSFDPSAPLALSPLLTIACTLAAVALLVVVFGKTRNASSSNK